MLKAFGVVEMKVPDQKPILVSGSTARRLLDIGSTKYWSLVKSNKIETVSVGRAKMVVYDSLVRLSEQPDGTHTNA
jgi:hypothetical protein